MVGREGCDEERRGQMELRGQGRSQNGVWERRGGNSQRSFDGLGMTGRRVGIMTQVATSQLGVGTSLILRQGNNILDT